VHARRTTLDDIWMVLSICKKSLPFGSDSSLSQIYQILKQPGIRSQKYKPNKVFILIFVEMPI